MDIDTPFSAWFGTPADVHAAAPGRVNLMGEHTDYNGGWVLPLALPLQTYVAFAKRTNSRVRVGSVDMPGEPQTFSLGDEQQRGDWLDYVRGAVGVMRERGAETTGVDIALASEVPFGAGLSSSAALCVGLLRGLSKLWNHPLTPVEIALLSQRIEHEWAGANVGVMDQMASSLGRPDAALYLNTATLEASLCPIPQGLEFLIIDSGARHSHATGDYNTRRSECEKAAKALGVDTLCSLEMTDAARIDKLPDLLKRRARHVVEENWRVHAAVAAMKKGNVQKLAALFDASHASQRDLYDVSVPAIDTLVEALGNEPEILGTRLTGGGFGGSVVSVAKVGTGVQAAQRAMDKVAPRGVQARLLNVAAVAEGAHGE